MKILSRALMIFSLSVVLFGEKVTANQVENVTLKPGEEHVFTLPKEENYVIKLSITGAKEEDKATAEITAMKEDEDGPEKIEIEGTDVAEQSVYDVQPGDKFQVVNTSQDHTIVVELEEVPGDS